MIGFILESLGLRSESQQVFVNHLLRGNSVSLENMEKLLYSMAAIIVVFFFFTHGITTLEGILLKYKKNKQQ